MNPYFQQPEGKKKMTLVGLYVALVVSIMVSLTNSIVLPAAAADIGGMEIYGLAQSISGILGVVVMPIFSFLAARNPHMKPWITAGGLLVGAAVMLIRGLAPNMFWIIGSNVFWGLVAAGIYVVGFTIIRDMYDAAQAGLYLGLIATMQSVGKLAGPALGGVIIDRIGWRVWPILLAVLLAASAVLILMGARITKAEGESLVSQGGAFDWAGGAAVTVLLACLIIALSLGGSLLPFGTPINTVLLVLAAVALVALVAIIRKKGDAAIVPASALANHNVRCLALINALHNFGAMTVAFFIASFIMRVLVDDPLVVSLGPATAAGLATVASSILGIFVGPIIGKKIGQTGDAKGAMLVGNIIRLIVTAGFIFFLVPGTPVWVIWLLMVGVGFYDAATATTMSAAPQILLPAELRVTGNSVVQLGQNLGSSIGMAIFTLIVGANPAGGMRTSMIIAFVAYVILLFVAQSLKKAEKAE